MASNDNYGVSEGTHNYVIDTFLNPHNYTCDKLYCHTYGATTQQVKDALNNGRSLAIYSGHGSETYWADGPVFYQSDVNSLTNDGMYPIVCSHACLTNQFTVSECFGETWLRAPHKGGVVFWGASTYSYWDEDDILERSMFTAWWNDNIEFICGMTNMGLYDLYQHYAGGGMSKYYFEEYNLLGDPSLKVWRDDPNPDLPPDTPTAPSGPTMGLTFVTYTFSVTAPADPEGQRVYVRWDWGDNETSEWLGPYTAGQQATASYAWDLAGVCNVRVKASDENGTESGWSGPLTVTIAAQPRLEITSVKGGIGVGMVVRNRINETLSNVAWEVSLKGGLLLYAIDTGGIIPTIASGAETTVRSGMIAGIGKVTLTMTVGDATMTATGFMLGPFLIGVK
jgi:hypothetical protein